MLLKKLIVNEYKMTVQYKIPEHWIRYDPVAVIEELTNAKASILSITNLPYQRSWAETLQELELKREVAGTSRIEGAEFTDHEFEEAVSGDAAGEYIQSVTTSGESRNRYISLDSGITVRCAN